MVPGARIYPRAVVAAWRAACRYRTGTLTTRSQLPRMLPIIEKHEPGKMTTMNSAFKGAE